MHELAKIAVVIVNYRTPELVKECLASLAPAAKALDVSVFVGDAASGDGSVEAIQSFIAREGLTWARCFAIGCNRGFAYGNNAIVERCVLPDPGFSHVWFLNPDTYVRPGALEALVSFLATHPEAGIAGSRLEDPDGTPRSFGFRAPRPWREFFRGARLGVLDRLVPQAAVKIEDLRSSRRVDWVTGASFMVRREVLDRIGLMDAGYFLYFEETDLMTRACAAGYEVWHVADSHVVHLAGQATGVRTGRQEQGPEPLSDIWLASRRRYMRKHFGRFGPARANLFFLAGDLVYRAHRRLRGRMIHDPPRMWRAYLSVRGEDG